MPDPFPPLDLTGLTIPSGPVPGTTPGANPPFDPAQLIAQILQGGLTGPGQPFGGLQTGDPARFETVKAATDNSPFVGMADVRTPEIKALELAGLFAPHGTLGTLMNPFGFADAATERTGAVPGRQGPGAERQAGQAQGLTNFALHGASVPGQNDNPLGQTPGVPWAPGSPPPDGQAGQNAHALMALMAALQSGLFTGTQQGGATDAAAPGTVDPTAGPAPVPTAPTPVQTPAPVAPTPTPSAPVAPTPATAPTPAGGASTIVPPEQRPPRPQGVPFNGQVATWESVSSDTSDEALYGILSQMQEGVSNAPTGTGHWTDGLLSYVFPGISDPTEARNVLAKLPRLSSSGAVFPGARPAGLPESQDALPVYTGTAAAILASFGTQQQGEAARIDSRAGGGPLDPSNITVVGEAGPEMILPGQGGQQQVVPIDQQLMQMLLGMGAEGMAQGGFLEQANAAWQGNAGDSNFIPGSSIISPSEGHFQFQNAGGVGEIGGQNDVLQFLSDRGVNTAQAGFGMPAMQAPPAGGGGTILNDGFGASNPTNNPSGFGGALGGGNNGGIFGAMQQNPELQAFSQIQNILGGNPSGEAGQAFDIGSGFFGNMLQGASDVDTTGLRNLGQESFLGPEISGALGAQLQTNPGQGIMDALQPVFQQNLQNAFGQLQSSAPSVFNSAQQQQGTDLGRQALNDFNLTAAQALSQGVSQQQQAANILGGLQGQGRQLQQQALGSAGQLEQGNTQNTIQGLGTLGQLGQGASAAADQGLGALTQAASNAGQNPFSRLLQGGQLGLQQSQLAEQSRQFNNQFDLQAQQQQFNQTVGPTMQLLLAAMGLSEPTALQTVVGANKQ